MESVFQRLVMPAECGLFLLKTMILNQKALEEFKQIYLEETGEPISDQQANETASDLVNLMKIIYRPLPKNYSAQEKRK